MTGLELLKQEMLNRGCTKAQCDSKAVLIVLDIVSKADGKYLLLAGLESIIRSKRLEITCLNEQIEQLKIDRQKAKKEYEEMEQLRYNRKMKKLQETDDYIKQFFEALEQAETPEARDRLRVAQTFINSVDIDTKYDNTAFIVGLSALLSGVQINPLKEIQKINPKITNEYRRERISQSRR